MSLSSDLNFLAANNIIGYDTCDYTLRGMGYNNQYRSGLYGRGKVLSQDTFTKRNVNATELAKTGIVAGIGLAIGSKVINKIKKTDVKGFFKSKNIDDATKVATETAKKATKSSGSVLKKIAKGGKVALIATGIATIASGIFKLYNANKAQLSANGQPNVAGSPAMTMVTPQAPVQEFTSESA